MIQDPHRLLGAVEGELRSWLAALVGEVADAGAGLGVRLVDEAEMSELNRRFRRRQGPTDVLAFEGVSRVAGSYLGDVVVSVPTARRQALEAGHDLERELKILLLHGVLHCLGHDHESDDGEMVRLERRLRREWIDD